MERDQTVPFPPAAPTASGDFVLYSSESGDVTGSEPGDVLGTRRISGWYGSADRASTFKVQVFSPQAAAWVTINGTNGAGVSVSAGDLCVFNVLRPAGKHRLVATIAAGAPTDWQHPATIRLIQDGATSV